jgi:hypothetical protein
MSHHRMPAVRISLKQTSYFVIRLSGAVMSFCIVSSFRTVRYARHTGSCVIQSAFFASGKIPHIQERMNSTTFSSRSPPVFQSYSERITETP